LETLGGKVSFPTIRFGTAGWRALIARDFTFGNIRLATQAVADYLKAELANPRSEIHGRKPNVILAYDCRFLGRQFALAAAEVFAGNGLTPLLCNRDTPTPVLAFTIRKRKAIGGINITASHNPPEYSGFKFSRHDGAGAPPEATRPIEEIIARLQRQNWSFKSAIVGTFECKNIDPQAEYFRQIRKLVEFSTIKKAHLKVAVDLMHGCGHGYLDTLLKEAGAALTVLHEDPSPLFGGHPPEPSAAHLAGMTRLVRAGKVRLGLATDGDADRFGVVDSDGTWITPNQVLALTLYHLAKHRGWKGAAVRTVVTSHQVDAVAARFGVRMYEVPVGFKYIGAIMEREPVIVGGEESGGLSVLGHVPEKDGILACLLMAELVAAAGKSLGAILKEITKLGGDFFTERINIHVDPDKKEELLSRLSGGVAKIGPFPVEKHITTDGFKFILPNGQWVAFRASGTEPVFRCYIEARSKKNLDPLRAACRALLD
jgi:alpha-D-glucose phosphate-specific phosphoglucomutase